jgi:hypothetical protein
MSNFRTAAILAVMCAFASSASGQLIVGHRGASHDAPENTIAAYKLAIEQGADAFEGDYWLGADGHIMCLHDADTKRVGGKKLSVTKAPFDELRALDVGSWKDPKWHGEKIPTLDEVEEVFPGVEVGARTSWADGEGDCQVIVVARSACAHRFRCRGDCGVQEAVAAH